jgi:hypothetical protein
MMPAATRSVIVPTLDEPHVRVWRDYAGQVARHGSIAVLAAFLPQLRFPIRAGMKRDPLYRRTVRHGEFSADDHARVGFTLEQPALTSLSIHHTMAGAVPVIMARDRRDFCSLVCALANGNEPRPLPGAFGGCVVSGFTNWHRIHLWCQSRPDRGRPAAAELRQALRGVLRDRAISKDRFFLLSDGPYSGVAAGECGYSDDAWRHVSGQLRLEHEATHYFTQRVLGATADPLVDEIVADWAAMTAVTGRYRADWFVRFMGLDLPDTSAGRLQQYCDRHLPAEELQRIRAKLRRAAAMLETFTDRRLDLAAEPLGRVRLVLALESLTLDDLASTAAAARLDAILARPAQIRFQPEAEES